ncbi:MAG: M3 family metallopeptidase [bacterium]|nr:Zn-dependent oligopeptidase [Gemmatimonadota bacterium]
MSKLLRRLPVISAAVLMTAVPALASRNAPLIDYTTVNQDMVEKECAKSLARADEIVEEMVSVKGPRTFENTMMPLNEVSVLLGQTFGRYAFMGYVADDPELRETARSQEEAMDKFGVDLGFREDIFEAVEAYSKTPEAKALTGEKARLLEFTLRDFRRNGFGKSKEVRDEVQELKKRLVELGQSFEKTLADWEDSIEVPPSRAGGLPASYLEGLKKADNGNYIVTLDYPDFFPFMDFAEDAELRREIMEKSWNEGYPQNVETLEEAIAVRDRIAQLLEYPSWAAYRVETRMAKTPENVNAFLEDLRVKVRPKFEQDIALMKSTVAKDDPDGVNYWDWRYYHNRQMKEQYQVDSAEISKYFPLDRVLKGMFDITQEMFGIRYEEVKDAKTWNPDVQLFEIYDAASGDFIADFYVDLFPRDGKFGHAAAFPLRSGGRQADGSYRTPISAIVANVTKPTADKPSLLTHDEVETMFHEFGHILHQTLTHAELDRFAGSATEQDFVEAPSQNLEHWVWEPAVLDRFAAHYETGEKLPRDMLNGMIAAKNLNSGIKWLRQNLYASLDMAYSAPGAKKNTSEILTEMHPICGFPNTPTGHFQAGFGHLFGYDAAYYGYLWSKVYGDDMWSVFEENGVLAPSIGMRYRKEIYEKGGTMDGADLLRNFLGREPNNVAFLKDLGLEVDSTEPVGSN